MTAKACRSFECANRICDVPVLCRKVIASALPRKVEEHIARLSNQLVKMCIFRKIRENKCALF